MEIDKITFLIQGAEYFNEHGINCTKKTILDLLNIFPKSKIIFSTWEGVVLNYPNEVKILYNSDPGVLNITNSNFLSNIKRQFVSTSKGLNQVDTLYVLKLRSDVKIDIIKFKNKLLNLKFDDNKIYFFLESIPLKPFMFDDKVQLSTIYNMKKLWNIQNESFFSIKNILELENLIENHNKKILFEACNGYHFSPEQLLLLLSSFNINQIKYLFKFKFKSINEEYFIVLRKNYKVETKYNFGINSYKNKVKINFLILLYREFININLNTYFKSLIFKFLLFSSVKLENIHKKISIHL